MVRKQSFKRLVILTPGFPINEQDTTCLPAQQIFIRGINRIFPELHIIILSLQYPESERKYFWNGNKVIALNGKRFTRLTRPLLWLYSYQTLKRIHHLDKIDGLLSFWCQDCALVGKFFSTRFQVPHYCWILGQDARKENKFVSLIRPRETELIAMSDFLAKEFYKNHQIKPANIVNNGIDASLFKGSPKAARSIDVLGVGSLIQLKQYHVFIDVIRSLQKEMPNLKAVICGKGPKENELIALVKNYGLTNNVSFMGELPHQQIINLMQQSRILLHPSQYEGYSTVCLESLNAGCHVISFVEAEARKIEHWNIAKTKEEMIQLCLSILKFDANEFYPVTLHHIEDNVRSIMKLYNYYSENNL